MCHFDYLFDLDNKTYCVKNIFIFKKPVANRKVFRMLFQSYSLTQQATDLFTSLSLPQTPNIDWLSIELSTAKLIIKTSRVLRCMLSGVYRQFLRRDLNVAS